MRWARRRTGGPWCLAPGIVEQSNSWMQKRVAEFAKSAWILSVRLRCNRSRQMSFMLRQRSLNRADGSVGVTRTEWPAFQPAILTRHEAPVEVLTGLRAQRAKC